MYKRINWHSIIFKPYKNNLTIVYVSVDCNDNNNNLNNFYYFLKQLI
jgi:hypothetical protein